MAKESSPAKHATPGPALDQRSFLRTLSAGASAAVALHSLGKPSLGAGVEACELGPETDSNRKSTAQDIRCEAAQLAFERPYSDHVCNGEEDDYGGTRIANFSKGLPHNDLGEVDPAAYNALLTALASRDQPTLRPSREAFVRPSSQEQAAIVSCESAIGDNTSLRLKVPLGPRPVMAPFIWGHCQHGASKERKISWYVL